MVRAALNARESAREKYTVFLLCSSSVNGIVGEACSFRRPRAPRRQVSGDHARRTAKAEPC